MLIDNQVTRLQNGITNLNVGHIFNSMKIPDPSIYHAIFEDFDAFVSASWSVGGVGTPSRALQAGLGGLLRLSGLGASGDNSWIQTTNPTYQITVGKKIFFRSRVTLDDATNAVAVAGLQIAVAANNFLTPVNGIFWRKSAAQTGWELVSRAASVETTTGNIFTAVAATQVSLEFFFDGVDTLWAGVNGNPLAKITPAALPSVLLGLTEGLQNGTAAIRTNDVDQILVLQER